MGVDLTLLVVTGTREFGFSHTLLQLERRRELWDPIAEIEKAHGQPAPTNFASYVARIPDGEWKDESGYGKVEKTPYGDPVRMVPASALLALRDHRGVKDNPANRATWAYLAELPGATWIALWWS